MNAITRAALALALALGAAGCRKTPPEPPAADEDAGPRRRVFEPPPGQVRAVWPHEIRSDGVGPYLLGASLEEIFDVLPGGPRIEILQVEDVANYNIVRGEGARLIIGAARRGPVGFIAVVGQEIARTSSGAGVGATKAQLDEAMGAALDTAGRRVTDPRVRAYASMPGVRFLLEGGKVEAVLAVGGPSGDDAAPPADAEAPGRAPRVSREPREPREFEEGDCDRTLPPDDLKEAVAAAGLAADAPVSVGCFLPGGAQVLSFGGERISVVSRKGSSPGRMARLPLAGLMYAAPLDTDGDGRDEIVAVTRTTGETTHEYGVVVIRVDPARMSVVASESLYEVTRMGAALTGAALPEVDLYIDLARGPGGSAEGKTGRIEVGGVYVHREGGVVRDAAPLLPRSIEVRRRRGATAAKPVDADVDGAEVGDGAPPTVPVEDGAEPEGSAATAGGGDEPDPAPEPESESGGDADPKEGEL